MCNKKLKPVLFLCTESASNLRRDITAETSLMNDLDKRFNFDFDGGNTEPYGKRNVNLLISFNSDENLTNNSPTWLNNGSSKTNSDNGSISRSGKHSIVLLIPKFCMRLDLPRVQPIHFSPQILAYLGNILKWGHKTMNSCIKLTHEKQLDGSMF